MTNKEKEETSIGIVAVVVVGQEGKVEQFVICLSDSHTLCW